MSEAVLCESIPEQPRKVKGRWGGLLSMAFSFVIDSTEGGLINSLFPVIRDALGMNLSALGIFSSISRFARMIFGPIWAMLADKYGRKKVLVFITGVWGIWTIPLLAEQRSISGISRRIAPLRRYSGRFVGQHQQSLWFL